MAEQTSGSFFYHNGSYYPTEDFSAAFRESSPAVYEVIRVMAGVPLFLEEHYARLENSLASIEQASPMPCAELAALISELVAKCGLRDINVRLIFNNFTAEGRDFTLFCIPTHYPTPEMYAAGVPTDFLSAERSNPHAKIINNSLRASADAVMAEKGLFEAILVNAAGEITEGSKSNLFFIRGDEICTAPAEAVLLGVTRQRVLRICAEHGLSVKEVPIRADELSRYEAAFISGTSPKCLPIANIGAQKLDTANTLLRRVMALYDGEIDSYLAARRG